jgi:hypothetical protein
VTTEYPSVRPPNGTISALGSVPRSRKTLSSPYPRQARCTQRKGRGLYARGTWLALATLDTHPSGPGRVNRRGRLSLGGALRTCERSCTGLSPAAGRAARTRSTLAVPTLHELFADAFLLFADAFLMVEDRLDLLHCWSGKRRPPEAFVLGPAQTAPLVDGRRHAEMTF